MNGSTKIFMYNEFDKGNISPTEDTLKLDSTENSSLCVKQYSDVKNPIDLWAEIEFSAGEFQTITEAKSRFIQEFLSSKGVNIGERCFFLFINAKAVATSTAWYGKFGGKEIGRLHWVAVKKNFQGRGVSKFVITTAMNYLRSNFSSAYLVTQPSSYKAIKIYLREGFVPVIKNEEENITWNLVKSKISALHRPT